MRALLLVALALPLTGCDSQMTLQEVCNTHPEYCEDVPLTGWCVKERSEVIWKRYEHNDKDPNSIYNELLSLENFVNCIEKAVKIENREQAKERESARVESYIAAQTSLTNIQEKTQNDASPYLSFYHWTRFHNRQALNRFLDAESQGKLDSATLKGFAASYYSQSDPKRATGYLLETLPELPQPAVDAFLDLSKLFMDQRNNEQAYIFAKMAAISNPEMVNPQRLKMLSLSSGQKQSLLDEQAQQRLTQLAEGKFSAKSIKM